MENRQLAQQIEESMLKGEMTAYLMQQSKGYVKFFIRSGMVQKEYFPISYSKNIQFLEDEGLSVEIGMKYSTLKTICKLVTRMLENFPKIEYGTLCIPFKVDKDGSTVLFTDIEFEKENHIRRH